MCAIITSFLWSPSYSQQPKLSNNQCVKSLLLQKNSATTPWVGVTGSSMLPVLISHLSTTDLSWVLQVLSMFISIGQVCSQ